MLHIGAAAVECELEFGVGDGTFDGFAGGGEFGEEDYGVGYGGSWSYGELRRGGTSRFRTGGRRVVRRMVFHGC